MTKRETRASLSAKRERSDNSNTSDEVTRTIDNFLKELEESGRKVKKANNGHRAMLRESLETAQHIIVKLMRNNELQKQFVRAVQKAKKGRKSSTNFNWSLEVVAKATGASSSKARKLASKRAGVLEYLRDRGVAANDTAATVKKEGVEKLYSAWCKKKKEAKGDHGDGRRHPPKNHPKSEEIRNDKEVILPLWMKSSEREQLLDQKLGAMLTVLVSRVSEDEGAFKVKRVMVADSLGEPSDWDD
jgi:hypothetical protein